MINNYTLQTLHGDVWNDQNFDDDILKLKIKGVIVRFNKKYSILKGSKNVSDLSLEKLRFCNLLASPMIKVKNHKI